MPNYDVKTGLPQLPSGLNEADFALVRPLYLAMNSLAQGLGDATGAVDFTQGELAQRNQLASLTTQQHRKLYARNDTGVALGFGKIVTLTLSGGKIIAQLADSTNNTKPAHGIVNNPLGINAGDYGEIMLIEGYSKGIAGTTFGLYYYLSTVGNVQTARPAAAGTIIQACGFGLGTAGFYLHISPLFLQN